MGYIRQMTTFEEFTRARYATLLQERKQLYMKLRILQKEMEEIEKAARASGLKLIEPEVQQPRSEDIISNTDMTMKEASVEVLKKHPNGLPATKILAELNKILGTSYVRSSLSPQLSRLKRDGAIYDVNGIWILTKEGPERP